MVDTKNNNNINILIVKFRIESYDIFLLNFESVQYFDLKYEQKPGPS